MEMRREDSTLKVGWRNVVTAGYQTSTYDFLSLRISLVLVRMVLQCQLQGEIRTHVNNCYPSLLALHPAFITFLALQKPMEIPKTRLYIMLFWS